ncbi:hypothetical protein C823_007466 [Eubacterium plexicaudatum ASF492]|nr:hypothetical protein C823_007466 [Eubacterium plexicaudatum ASF492]
MAKEQECLIFQFQHEDSYYYTIPIGNGNRKGALDAMLAMAQETGRNLCWERCCRAI